MSDEIEHLVVIAVIALVLLVVVGAVVLGVYLGYVRGKRPRTSQLARQTTPAANQAPPAPAPNQQIVQVRWQQRARNYGSKVLWTVVVLVVAALISWVFLMLIGKAEAPTFPSLSWSAPAFSVDLTAPSLPSVASFIQQYWFWLVILGIVVLVATFFSPKEKEKAGKAVRTIFAWAAVILIALVLWKGSGVSSLFDYVNYQDLTHDPYGDTLRFTPTSGMVADFKGPGLVRYCVYEYRPGLYQREVQQGPRGCDWERVTYQFAHDTSGEANSIKFAWVDKPK